MFSFLRVTHPGIYFRDNILPIIDLDKKEIAKKLIVSDDFLETFINGEPQSQLNTSGINRLGTITGTGPKFWYRLTRVWIAENHEPSQEINYTPEGKTKYKKLIIKNTRIYRLYIFLYYNRIHIIPIIILLFLFLNLCINYNSSMYNINMILSAGTSAILWLWSALKKSVFRQMEYPFLEEEQNHLNAWAAGFTGLAVGLQAIQPLLFPL